MWAPTEALKNAIEFHQDKIPHVPFDCIREFLHKMNGAWLEREQRHCDRLEASDPTALGCAQRVTQHGIPYEKIAADKEIAKLKAEHKKARRSRLKGRPSSRVERSSVKSMRASARDELLAASLSAMECMSRFWIAIKTTFIVVTSSADGGAEVASPADDCELCGAISPQLTPVDGPGYCGHGIELGEGGGDVIAATHLPLL